MSGDASAPSDDPLQGPLLRAVLSQAPALIAVLRGRDHVVQLANPPICRAWGRAEQDLLRRPLLDAVPELRGQEVQLLLDQVYATGVADVRRETAVSFDRGAGTTETLYFNFVYAPLRSAGERIEGVIVIASDVTVQVLARDQLNVLREAAESATRAKDQFLAVLSHELRNPLAPIRAALSLLRDQGFVAAERERAVAVLDRQLRHLTSLVDDLLDVSRIVRGKVQLRPEVVELGDVVATAIETAGPLLRQRRHQLAVDVPRQGLAVDGDPIRLGQVVSNLLNNAAKYTPPGGDVTVRAEADGGDVVLRVRDTGIGIRPDIMPRIFDLFVQERPDSDPTPGGLGIGLSIVRELVEQHGGSVSAHSEGSGQGSEMVVRLPRATRVREAAAPAPAAVVAAPARPDPPQRVLVVDDNEDGADMLADMLIKRGYEARVANDAATALRMAAEWAPSVALLDLGLPVMNGYELASRLRDLPGLVGLRLIAVTGYARDADRKKTRDAGFHGHLVKPVEIDDIDAVTSLAVTCPPGAGGGTRGSSC